MLPDGPPRPVIEIDSPEATIRIEVELGEWKKQELVGGPMRQARQQVQNRTMDGCN